MDNSSLKKITEEELRDVIAAHGRWLLGDLDKGCRASLSDYDLSNRNLASVDLRFAILDHCNLTDAVLEHARLDDADFVGANLTNASLRLASLARANLSRAILTRTDFTGARLRESYLVDAIIDGAIFNGADIAFAAFDRADTAQIARLDFGGGVSAWPVTVRPTETTIGCQRHSNAEWLSWTADSPEIWEMHHRAPDWWALYGDAVKATINAVVDAVRHNTKQRESKQK